MKCWIVEMSLIHPETGDIKKGRYYNVFQNDNVLEEYHKAKLMLEDINAHRDNSPHIQLAKCALDDSDGYVFFTARIVLKVCDIHGLNEN
jgi:hypothetical protein